MVMDTHLKSRQITFRFIPIGYPIRITLPIPSLNPVERVDTRESSHESATAPELFRIPNDRPFAVT